MQTATTLSVKASRSRLDDSVLWGLAMALWILAFAWIRPLSDPDEGRYAVVALDMLRTGNWVTPHLNGLPFFHKPPLYYWLAAGGYELFGVHAWVARVPSMLGAWLASMSLLVLARRYTGTSTAITAVIIFLTMPFAYLAAQYANMDMLLAGCMCACTTCAFIATIELTSANVAYLDHGSWCFCGSRLSRQRAHWPGLAGLDLVNMDALGASLEANGASLYPPVWLAILAVAGPWAWFAQKQHPQFFHYFFVTQHFQRYTETGFNNPQPWWFYLAVIALHVFHGLWLESICCSGNGGLGKSSCPSLTHTLLKRASIGIWWSGCWLWWPSFQFPAARSWAMCCRHFHLWPT
jgi:4-amino-4-deoxy-L-arabinose transferase-like glycosyltransferase